MYSPSGLWKTTLMWSSAAALWKPSSSGPARMTRRMCGVRSITSRTLTRRNTIGCRTMRLSCWVIRFFPSLIGDFLEYREAEDEEDHGDDDGGPEQELGDAHGGAGQAGEAEHAGDQADDGEDDGPLDHANTPWLQAGLIGRLGLRV